MKILEKDTHEAKLLVIEDGEGTEDFTRKMIRRVKDPLFLPLAGPTAGTLCAEGFGYDISGFVPLSEALENRTLSASEITAVLIRIGNAILLLESHLLGDENLLLSPDRIYVRPDVMEPVFCPSLSAEESFEERLRPLVSELFLHADTEDPPTLKLASELLKISLRKHYRMHDLLEAVENGTAADRLPDGRLPDGCLPADRLPDGRLPAAGVIPVQGAFASAGPASKRKYRPLARTVTAWKTDAFSVSEQEDVLRDKNSSRVGGNAIAVLPSEEDLFAQWPDESALEKDHGFVAEMKKYASAVIAWVRGDDEIVSADGIKFEDHT